jgi:transposase
MSGRRLKEHVIETNGTALRAIVQSIAGDKHICIEEGELSEWIYELILPLAKEVMVIQSEKRDGPKSDSIDAWELADIVRTRRKATVVYKSPGVYSGLKESVQSHRALTGDVVRSKNRLKSVFRGRGIRVTGAQIYDAESRPLYLKKLSPARRKRAALYGEHLDNQVTLLKQAEEWLHEEVRRCPIVKIICTAPGIGLIRASQTVATVVQPNRFRTKRQFWAYCGLAVVKRSTSDWKTNGHGGVVRRRKKSQTRGLNRNRNPLLKEVFKGAAMTVIQSMPNDPLCQNYRRAVDDGMDPDMARLTLARQIAAIVLAMWKTKEVYDPTRYKSSKTA